MAEPKPDRISLPVDRSTTARSSLQFYSENDDDNDLAAARISDGFRPTADSPLEPSRIFSPSSQRQRRPTPPPRPSSATKPSILNGSAMKHHRAMEPLPRRAATLSTSSATSINRSSSSSTEVPFVEAAGPSHPHHMFTQNTRLARTASVATSSTVTVPSERSYDGPSGPTHPYSTYTQNIVTEVDSLHHGEPIFSVPAGFPGHGGTYQRRLGPDGEQAGDMMGPLGHTEQLPPYTRFPENAVPHLPGAGGIGLATRDPEFASREDLRSPLSIHSNRHSMASDSGHQINIAAICEKPPDTKWKTLAEKRILGVVPVSICVVTGAVLLLLIIILGPVLVVLSHRGKLTSSNSNSSGTDTFTGTIHATAVTTSYDASPLKTIPLGIPPLPTGTFILPVVYPSFNQRNCLEEDMMYVAWSCDLPSESIEMTVAPFTGSANNKSGNKVTINANGSFSALSYGSQSPIIDPDAILTLVNDAEQTPFGPAWYSEVVYDKVVLLHQNELPPANKRDEEHRKYADWNSKAVAEGDMPWFCYWGGTILEIFIYIDQQSDSGNGQATSVPTSSTYAHQSTPTATTSGAASVGSKLTLLLEKYPNVVKVEERRNPADSRSRAPFCIQRLIAANGTVVTPLNEDRKPTVIYLSETEPSLAFVEVKRREPNTVQLPAASELIERGDIGMPRICRCVWLTQKLA